MVSDKGDVYVRNHRIERGVPRTGKSIHIKTVAVMLYMLVSVLASTNAMKRSDVMADMAYMIGKYIESLVCCFFFAASELLMTNEYECLITGIIIHRINS